MEFTTLHLTINLFWRFNIGNVDIQRFGDDVYVIFVFDGLAFEFMKYLVIKNGIPCVVTALQPAMLSRVAGHYFCSLILLQQPVRTSY